MTLLLVDFLILLTLALDLVSSLLHAWHGMIHSGLVKYKRLRALRPPTQWKTSERSQQAVFADKPSTRRTIADIEGLVMGGLGLVSLFFGLRIKLILG